MYKDTDLFLKLLEPEYNDALKYCKALCSKSSRDDAEDILQQSLLKALENFEKLNDESKFRSWFFKIITNEYFNHVRKNFWRRFLPIDKSMDVPEMPQVFVHDEENERSEILRNALAKISVKERSSILLFEVGGFSIEQIKEMQNESSISAIKSRLSRTRAKLKKLIEQCESFKIKQSTNSKLNIGDINNETVRLAGEYESKQ